MKATPSYVFMFIPSPSEWVENPLTAPHFSFGRTGSSAKNGKRNDSSRSGERPLRGSEPQALPSHLFWTRFVDDPRGANPS